MNKLDRSVPTRGILAAFMAFTFLGLNAQAQKKPLNHSVYDSWQRVSQSAVTLDGRVAAYTVSPQEGDAEVIFRNLESGTETKVARGSDVSLFQDGKWAVCKVKAPFQKTRQAKIDKKKPDQMPKDSLVFVNLETLQVTNLGEISKYKVPQEGRFLIAYEGKTETAAKSDSTKKAAKPVKTSWLVVLDPVTNHADSLRSPGDYAFNHDGSSLAVIYKKDKKDSLSTDRVVLYRLPDLDSTVLDQGKAWYGLPSFDIAGDKLAFLATNDTNATGSKRCGVILSEKVIKGKGRKATTSIETKEIFPQEYSENIPKGWCIPTNSPLSFSADSKRLFLGIAECVPEKDTTLVDFETAQLDIWNWDIYMTPPMQKANAKRLSDATCKSVINLDRPGTLIPLTTSIDEHVSPLDAGRSDWALVVDDRPYQISSTWDSNDFTDSYLVNLRDGSRKPLFKKLEGTPSPSPCGKYLTWYDFGDSNWYSYELATDRTVNLTKGLDATFFDDEDDHPMPKPYLDRPHWLEGDEAFLLAEKYDIWRIRPDGSKAECLTKGEGRAKDIQYRIVSMKPSILTREQTSAGLVNSYRKDDDVFLTTFNRTSKENGFARVNAAKSGLKSCFTAPAGYSATRASADCGTILFLKGDARHSNDQYFTRDFFATETKLSAINPQQSEYNWCDIQLVHWTAYDGTKLDGLLYTPEDLDPAKKYPMMVYFYEKNSENLYSYSSPAPSRSVINFSFYASRGYVVFIPDIVYTPGHPGESAYNCICSGAEAMCEQFPFIDKARMAIQGQSWGGYQTAYLVTRTHMFAAAGAGAPVGNMTSAYGGVRWESGHVRAMQYEHGQSRIGKSLWDEGGLDLYIENSPIFHTQDVTTPVLIMHNDNDGAVPWYQGIEFFMALRRFNHPAWLLEYNDEAHNLVQRRNCKDLSIRLQQFFDHYLQGAPAPAWMVKGVPTSRKSQYFGLEPAE
ncbi:MAG: prolyl oligopeptidase family serine peptidase [Bacteroidales bacterium]|nr:prolyl oligopeptidase family serine peptidase [Bacteroidales bacterium]